MSTPVAILAAALLLLGCGSQPEHRSARVRPRESRPSGPLIEIRDFAEEFTAEGVDGAFVMHERATQRSVQYQPGRCGTRYVPASTFKIYNTLIALETGVADGPDFALPWDGVEREIGAWNQDHTLRTAIGHSVVWYFQEIARRVGLARHAEWLTRIGYGNAEVGEAVDRFWLEGPLGISPNEQVDLLRRLDGGELPFSERSVDLLREMIVLAEGDGWVLRGKTGWGQPEGQSNALWLVGWVERGDDRHYFATLVLSGNPTPATARARFGVTARVLAALDVLPPGTVLQTW